MATRPKPPTDIDRLLDDDLTAAVKRGTGSVSLTRAEWADRIRVQIDTASTAILVLGRGLLDARDHLGHGEWTAMIRDDLGRSPRWAQQLMSVARHPIIGDAKHASLLPADTTAMYELSRLPADRVEVLLDDGTVTAASTRREVKALVSRERTHAEIEAAQERDERPVTVEPPEPAPPVAPSKALSAEPRHPTPEDFELLELEYQIDECVDLISAFVAEDDPDYDGERDWDALARSIARLVDEARVLEEFVAKKVAAITPKERAAKARADKKSMAATKAKVEAARRARKL